MADDESPNSNFSTHNSSSTTNKLNSTTADSIVQLTLPVSTKLNQSNFLTWKAQIIPTVRGNNLMRFLQGPAPSHTKRSADGSIIIDPDYLLWDRQDQLLLGWLRASITESIQSQVVSCETSADLWSNLMKVYSNTSRAKIADLRRQLQSTKRGDSSCTDFLLKIRHIADELAFAGSPVSDDDLILVVLNGLGPDFNAFVVAVTTRSNSDSLTFSDLHGMLLSHEALISEQLSASNFTNPQAFYAKHNPNSRNRSYSGKNSNYNPSKPQFSNSRPPNNNQSSRPSSKSSETASGSTFKKNTDSNGSMRRPPAPRADATCQICTRYGHIAKHCWYRFDEDPTPPFQAFVAQPHAPQQADNEWVLDTGASHHVTNDINNLGSFYQYTGSDNLHIGTGSGISISHIGNSTFSLHGTTLTLTDVLHVPTFAKNLISLSKLLTDNPFLTVEFVSSCCILKDHRIKKVVLQVCHSKGLYTILQPKPTSPPQAFIGIRASADKWHDRFGHPSQETTLNVIKRFSLPCNSNKMTLCHNCCLAKAHKLPFSPSSSSSKSVLELIHSDVWGPSPVPSSTGFRYYVIFVDDFSKHTWIYFGCVWKLCEQG